MRELSDGEVDLVFADPPFNIGYEYDKYRDKLPYERYLAWCREWFTEVRRVLNPHGTFWLAIGDDYAAELKVLATREIGLHCRSWVIWYYTFGVNCKRKFTRSHTHLFHFVVDEKRFTFNDETIRVPSARQLVYNDKRANAKGRLPDDTWILRPDWIPDDCTTDDSLLIQSRVCGTFKEREGWHNCQMPEPVLERIIKLSSNEKEKILDPFAGSGTTAVVTQKLGRQYLGFDVSEQYIENATKRLKNGSSELDERLY
jgi:site-specific DNA-methyltransferase (adenine-specific)